MSNLHFVAVHPEKLVGDSGKEQIPFNRKKPPAETGSEWPPFASTNWCLGQERNTDKHKMTSPGAFSTGRMQNTNSCS